jgi:2,4-dienoyl-CoA reductase-like NADH-dependent reductase (Old Yellow Enzyme family)
VSISFLFEPFELKSLKLKNRIAMAPMTRSFCPGGVPTDAVANYYSRRAAGGVGLILSEGAVVERPASANDPNAPRLWGDDALRAWRTVIDGVHLQGGAMAPQLWHVGCARNSQIAWRPEGPVDSPSGLGAAGRRFGEPMTLEAIADSVAAFGKAALNAKTLGFDALELHGAHGYLIDQFFWSRTNAREDAYGGADIGQRTRFAVEIIQEIRRLVGDGFPIIFRASQWKHQDFAVKVASDPKALERWLLPLLDAGVDIFHCSQRRFWEPEFPESDLNFAGWVKKVTSAPTITVGSVGLSGEFIESYGGAVSKPASLDDLLRRFERGDFDLVAVGRALIGDAEWARKIRLGQLDQLLDYNTEALKSLA